MEENIREKIGNQILFTRRKQGLTQIQLAEKAGVGVNTIYNIEAAKFDIKIDTLVPIFRALELTTIEL